MGFWTFALLYEQFENEKASARKKKLEREKQMSKSQYDFSTYTHDDLITIALNLPNDLEHVEYGRLVRELGLRLKRLKKALDRF